MNRFNWILTLFSLNTILLTVERFSFTTKVVLQPFSFLRLHEAFQIIVITLISVILSFLLLKEISHNFDSLKKKVGATYLLIFLLGLYFYSTGNGLHEVASFLFNNFCDKNDLTLSCGSSFYDDYYFGNILYFLGLILINLSLVSLEKFYLTTSLNKKQIIITLLNSLVYALTLFAYAAFDRVLIGLYFTVIASIIFGAILIRWKLKFTKYPYTTYLSFAYILSTVGSLIWRFLR